MSAKILYIEDNEQNMRLIRKILLHAGYEFIGAEDGHSGLEVAHAERPDVIIVDINLPDIDGLEVTSRLKRGELAHIPVIALTANAMVGDRERTLEAGCDAYLPKPVSRQDLLNLMAQFLGGE
ncbi:MAG: response regulator [Anaerolineae bacterium]|jgi:two-component system cell cycle response regulator DivK|nr:response regulator [Anaerolineae bacterium]